MVALGRNCTGILDPASAMAASVAFQPCLQMVSGTWAAIGLFDAGAGFHFTPRKRSLPPATTFDRSRGYVLKKRASQL